MSDAMITLVSAVGLIVAAIGLSLFLDVYFDRFFDLIVRTIRNEK